MWATGLMVAIVITVVIMELWLSISLLETILALVLAFSLSLVMIQATGATTLMGEFRVGYLLQTPAQLQYHITQLIGTLFATIIAPAIFKIFTTAYPYIIAEGEKSSSTKADAAQARRCEISGQVENKLSE
ncbi:unnamed protein product [Penicillium glandicola]